MARNIIYEIREYNHVTGHLETLVSKSAETHSREWMEAIADTAYDHSTDHTVYVAEVMRDESV